MASGALWIVWGQRKANFDPRPLGGFAADVEMGVYGFGTLPHVGEPISKRFCFRVMKTLPVILNDNDRIFITVGEFKMERLCVGVFDGVVEGFLANEENIVTKGFGQCQRGNVSGHLEVETNS